MIEIDQVYKSFGRLDVLQGVSMTVSKGEVISLIGGSGSGKSTLLMCINGLEPIQRGNIRVNGVNVHAPGTNLNALRQRIGIVFQQWNAFPHLTVLENVMLAPLKVCGLSQDQAKELAVTQLSHVGLQDKLKVFPGKLSGGQLQRVCIGRALATKPDLLVLDEPTSSLDVSVRAGILQLLDTLRRETGVAMLFISHDLETIHALCDRVVVLYLGCEVETGPVDAVFNKPAHPYTQALLSAQLFADPAVKTVRQHLQGEIPSPLSAPPGCPFSTRCPIYEVRCDEGLPAMRRDSAGVHAARCLRLPPDQFSSS